MQSVDLVNHQILLLLKFMISLAQNEIDPWIFLRVFN